LATDDAASPSQPINSVMHAATTNDLSLIQRPTQNRVAIGVNHQSAFKRKGSN